LFIDQLPNNKNEVHKLIQPKDKEFVETRVLQDSSTFQIVKIYYTPKELVEKMEKLGFVGSISTTPNEYFYIASLTAQHQ